MGLLRIHLLGKLTLSRDNRPLPPIHGAAARSLFAYLAIYRDRPHTRDLLIGTFWPDLPEVHARRRLSQALWQIRRALHPHPTLVTEGDTIQFNPDLPLWLDVEELEKLVDWKTGKRANEQGQFTSIPTYQYTDLQALNAAIKLYHGDFLAGYYDDWMLVERERLREVFLAALERLIDELKARGNYEGALIHARRLATEDVWREEAHCEVMRLCHLLGRDHEALQQYETCRQVLAQELDAEPSPSTAALADEIAAPTGEIEPPHLPVAARSSPLPLLERPDCAPLVGRQAERAELARYLEQVLAGSGGLVLLAGETGVGKTRLMQEVARDAAWRGIRVAWGHSYELYAPPPYQPLVEVLCRADLSHLPTIWRRELGRLLPELGPAMALAPEQERGRLLEAIARAFLALGQDVPHLIILEDVHWMDPASFSALRVLLPHLPTSHLLVVGTLRPEELSEQPAARHSLAALDATCIPRRLALGPLTAVETEALIQRVLAMTRPAPRFSRRLYAGTEGNPFFIAETLRALVDEGLLYRDEAGKWSTPWDDVTQDYAELPVPPNIAQSIKQRLARLSPTARDLLGIAAVVGRQVEFDVWLAAGECDERTTLATVEGLARRGLLAEMDDVLGYRFIHDAIRRVIYETLSPARRRRYHRLVADALEALHPEQVETLALHFRLGQDWPQAVRYALRAGERAQAVYANRQALDHYRRAEDWLAAGRVTWSADQIVHWRANLAEKQGQVYSLVGEYKAANAAFARARQMWAGLGDWRGEARALNRLSFLCFVQDNYVGASHYAELALAALPESDPPTQGEIEGVVNLRATSLTYQGLGARTQGRYDDALPLLEEALALFEEVNNDRYGLARCLNSLGLVHLEREALGLADPCFVRSLALRQEIGDRRGEAWCWHNQGRTALVRGDLATAREKLETAHAIFAEIQHPQGLDASAQVLAEVARAEAAAGKTSRITVRLPRADAPLGRPLRDDEWVEVTWSVAALEDDRIPGKVARRRRRILRLLAEAEVQAAAPRDQDLATALGVSLSTLRRDAAALCAAGHDLPTRWRKKARSKK